VRALLGLPAGVEFVSASPGGVAHAGGTMASWSLPALQPQGDIRASIRLRGAKGGDWALAASANAGTSRPARHTCAVLVEYLPKLTVEVTRLDESVRVGGETSVEVRLYNPGPGAVEQTQAILQLPEHLLPVQAEGPTRWRIDGQRVTFEAADLPARMDTTYRVRVRGVAAGPARLQSIVRAAGLAPIQQEAGIEVRP
jgi:hypothetical protein